MPCQSVNRYVQLRLLYAWFVYPDSMQLKTRKRRNCILYNESAGKYRLQADAERPNDSGTMTIYPDKKIEWIIEGKSPESMSGKFTLLPGTATEGIFKGTLKLRIDGEGYLFSPAYAYFTYTWFGWDSSLPSDTLYLSRYDDGSGTFYGWVKH